MKDLSPSGQREGAEDLGLDLHGEVGVLKYGIEAAMDGCEQPMGFARFEY